jgi:hypothetical protein
LYKLIFSQNTYIFAGLDYHIPGTNFDNFDFSSQAEQMYGIGIEGYKMYEGKPSSRKACGNIPLTDRKYTGFFNTLQKRGIPLALHLADPPEFWESTALNAYQVSKGWFFGDMTFSSWKEIYEEVFSVTVDYKNIPFIIPQFGYLFPDLDKLSLLLDKYPNLFFDIAPAGNYFEFLKNNADLCRSFFEKYSTRLIFACTGVCDDWSKAPVKARKILDALSALELSKGAMERILGSNFLSLCTWRILDKEKVRKYAIFVKDRMQAYSIIPEYSGIVNRTFEVIDAINGMVNS